MKPRRTVFDARTASIVRRLTSNDAGLATLPLSTLGTRFATTGRLAYNITRVMNIMGTKPLIAAMRA